MKNYLMAIDNELQEYFNNFINDVDTLSLNENSDKVSEFINNIAALLDYYAEPIFINAKKVILKQIGVSTNITLNYKDIEVIEAYKNSDITEFCNTLKRGIISFYGNTDNKQLYEQINEIIIGFCIKFFKKAQLIECLTNDIKEVELVTDNVISCPICQTKSKFTNSVNDLLMDIDNIHPFCKLVIEPIMDDKFNAKINLKIDKTEIEFINLFYRLQDRVKSVVTQLKVLIPELITDKKFIFVNEITEQPEFIEIIRTKYSDNYEDILNKIKGKITTFKYEDKIFICNKDLKNLEYLITKYLIEEKTQDNDLSWWAKEYDEKLKSKYVADGSAVYANPFVSYMAEADYKSYFLESVIYYTLNPMLLKSCDLENYNMLKSSIFNNIEFIRR